jgi:hypothetical protein
MILIYNTLLRMSGFPEDYSLSLFESKVWAIVVVNIIASIVFFIILLRERCIEKRKDYKEYGARKLDNTLGGILVSVSVIGLTLLFGILIWNFKMTDLISWLRIIAIGNIVILVLLFLLQCFYLV